MKFWAKPALLGGIPFVVLSWGAARLSAQDQAEDARSMLALAVIVGAVMATSVIYDVDAWSLRRQSAVHLAVMAVTVLPALCLSGWFATQAWGDFALIGGYFFGVGLIIWSVAYLVLGVVVPRIKERAGAADAP